VVVVLVVVGSRGRKGGLGVVGLRLVYVHSLAEETTGKELRWLGFLVLGGGFYGSKETESLVSWGGCF
jgi:hypothetical protein